jgi:hypothetical protein
MVLLSQRTPSDPCQKQKRQRGRDARTRHFLIGALGRVIGRNLGLKHLLSHSLTEPLRVSNHGGPQCTGYPKCCSVSVNLKCPIYRR